MNTTRRSTKLLALAAASVLVIAACGGDDDDGGASATTEASGGGETTATTEASGETTATTEAMEETTPTTEASGDTTATTEAGGGDTGTGEYDWADVRRRQAVSMAIDRKAITDAIFLGSRQPADDFWPGTFAGYRGGDWCANLQYNPEAAKALWDEAGGTTGPITFWFNSGAGHDEWIEAVSNQLKENLGITEVKFESLEFADYLDKLDAGEVNGPFRLGWLMDYPSPGNFLGPIHTTGGSSNHTGYSNPDFDAAVAAGDSKALADAIPDYQAADDILCEDVPISPMFFGLFQAVSGPNVANVSFNPFQALNVTEVQDVDGDGNVSMYVCEPQNGLFGQMTNETCGSEVVNGLFTGLWSLDKDSGEIVFDGVADSVETTDDGTTWTIKLKDGWTFHDGSPVNAQSFINAWNWAAYGPNGAQNQYFIQFLGIQGFDAMNPPEDSTEEAATELTGLSAPDDLTISVTLDNPFPQLPLVMLYNAFNPLPDVFFDDPEGFGEAPVGNGPFMMDGSWEHDVQVATVAYPDYAGNPPQIDSLTYKIYSDDATAYNDVRSGGLDIIDTIPTAELGNFKTEFADSYIEEQTSSFNYLGFPIDLELAASWAG